MSLCTRPLPRSHKQSCSPFLSEFSLLFFCHNPVHQERFDPDPQGHLSDWSRESEEGTWERTDKRGAETKTGVWKHQWCLSQVGKLNIDLTCTRVTLPQLLMVTYVVAVVVKSTRTSVLLCRSITELWEATVESNYSLMNITYSTGNSQNWSSSFTALQGNNLTFSEPVSHTW